MDKASMDIAWTQALGSDDGDMAGMLIAAGSNPADGICGGASPLERARRAGASACLAAIESGKPEGDGADVGEPAARMEGFPGLGEIEGSMSGPATGLSPKLESILQAYAAGAPLPEGVQVLDLGKMDPAEREAAGLPSDFPEGAKVVRLTEGEATDAIHEEIARAMAAKTGSLIEALLSAIAGGQMQGVEIEGLDQDADGEPEGGGIEMPKAPTRPIH